MKYIKYSRYAPDAADDIDLQELMNRLSDFFLQSGFESQYGIYELDMEQIARAAHGPAARSDSARAAGRRPDSAGIDGEAAARIPIFRRTKSCAT